MKRLFLFVIFIMGSLLIFGCSGGLDEVSVDDKVIHLRLVNDAEEDIDRIKAGSPAHLVAIRTLINADKKNCVFLRVSASHLTCVPL